ncbi:hypothetical protein [Thalassospira alkalitolerans]|uniref:hypothetical protein n=1 Tax=Thalassospira alkalitolerans TaxID=1293890 RepID=UPI003AA8814D
MRCRWRGKRGRYKGGIKAGADRGAERSDRNDRRCPSPRSKMDAVMVAITAMHAT